MTNNDYNNQNIPTVPTPTFQEYQESFNQPRPSVVDNRVPAVHSQEPIRYKPKPRKTGAATFFKLILTIAVIIGLAWLLREFVFQAYEIPSGSMETTIMTGDVVFAEKLSHRFGSPKRGDIITFNDPEVSGRILIKRVIATGGQTVNIKGNKVYVDNVQIDEPYTNGLPTKQLASSKVKFPYTIPDGEVWVMGDNRTNSQDSRYYGSVPESSIIGHALAVYWPTSDIKLLT